MAILCVLTVGAVAFYLDKLHSVDLGGMTGLGLISVLPVSTLRRARTSYRRLHRGAFAAAAVRLVALRANWCYSS